MGRVKIRVRICPRVARIKENWLRVEIYISRIKKQYGKMYKKKYVGDKNYVYDCIMHKIGIGGAAALHYA